MRQEPGKAYPTGVLVRTKNKNRKPRLKESSKSLSNSLQDVIHQAPPDAQYDVNLFLKRDSEQQCDADRRRHERAKPQGWCKISIAAKHAANHWLRLYSFHPSKTGSRVSAALPASDRR
jgi:hypothetical protein